MVKSSTVRLQTQRAYLVEAFGGKCEDCGIEEGSGVKLEFAHKRDTGVNGKGRGSWRRYKNVRDNRDAYRLLCKLCHYAFDHPDDAQGFDFDPQGHWSG